MPENGKYQDKTDTIEKIKTEFIESPDLSIRSLADKYGISYNLILKICKSENWRDLKASTTLKRGVNKEQIDHNTTFQRGASKNGASNGSVAIIKEAPQQPHDDTDASQKEELASLRQMAFRLATNAAKALYLKEDWSPKEFDLFVGTYVKVVGAQVKTASDTDSIDRLIGELTQADDICIASEEVHEAHGNN